MCLNPLTILRWYLLVIISNTLYYYMTNVCLSVCLSVNGVMRDGGLLLVLKYFVIHNFFVFFLVFWW